MRWNVPVVAALVVALAAHAVPCVRAQNAQGTTRSNPAPANAPARPGTPAAPAPPPVDPRHLDPLLKLWEQNSAALKTLDVQISRTDRSPTWDEDDHYDGRAMFRTPNLAFLHFKKEKVVEDPKTRKKQATLADYERIVCTGTEVWHYRCESNQIFIYPLEKDVQQRALEEGPLPFLFNFKVAEAKKRYEMALVAEDAQTATLRILPLLPIDQESFKKAFVILDRKLYLLPRRIFLLGTDEKSSKDFVLKLSPQVVINPVVEANFHPEVPKGWKVVRNPGANAAPAPAAASSPPAGPAPTAQPQPALKPRGGIFRRN